MTATPGGSIGGGRPAVIQCVAHALDGLPGIPPAPVGQWLASYDPEAGDGRGVAAWTSDPAAAMVFATAAAAFECWRSVPRNLPVRDDGQPNRPLTSFTVKITAPPAGAQVLR